MGIDPLNKHQFRHSEEADPLYNDDAYEKFLEEWDELDLFMVKCQDHVDEMPLYYELSFIKNLFHGKYKEARDDYLEAIYFDTLRLKTLKKGVKIFAMVIESSEDDLVRFRSRGDEKNAVKREMALKRLKEAHAMFEARIAKYYPLPRAPAPRSKP